MSRNGGLSSYCCIQQRHSYLRPKPGAVFEGQLAANDDLLDYCRSRDITMLAYSPLLGGLYSRPEEKVPDAYRGPDSDARIRTLNEISRAAGCAPGQIVLAWMRESTPPVIPVIGISSISQLEENLGSLSLRLGADLVSALDAASA